MEMLPRSEGRGAPWDARPRWTHGQSAEARWIHDSHCSVRRCAAPRVVLRPKAALDQTSMDAFQNNL